jgi:hypothetical protein
MFLGLRCLYAAGQPVTRTYHRTSKIHWLYALLKKVF